MVTVSVLRGPLGGLWIKLHKKTLRNVMENGAFKVKQSDVKNAVPEEVKELINRFRTLRTIYNECARAIEIHCHQLTYWSENVVPHINEEELSEQTSLARDDFVSACSKRSRRLLKLLDQLKEKLSVYYDQLLKLKKAFDRLYYAKPSKDAKVQHDIKQGYSAIQTELGKVKGVLFIPSDSLLWNPLEGTLGSLQEFDIIIQESLGEPEKVIDCSHRASIKSPVSLLRTIFKSPLSVLSKGSSSSQPRHLFKSKSVPKLHHF